MLLAGARTTVIDPITPQFLFGYPHVERYHTGIHDSLFTASLYLREKNTEVVFITNDVIYVSKDLTRQVREKIREKTGIPTGNILISATHTHSGPITSFDASNSHDPVVPQVDQEYVSFLIEKIAETAISAKQQAEPALLGFTHADSSGIGTNRRNAAGPANHDVPVLLVKSVDLHKNIACMLIVSMHPTVMHEDSKLISADFIGAAREYIQEKCLGKTCVVLTHNGPCGNLSPRHITQGNTFSEVHRIGEILGKAVQEAISHLEFFDQTPIKTAQSFIENIPQKQFPTREKAQIHLVEQKAKIQTMKAEHAKESEIRTIECDIFGAEETLTLSSMQESGALKPYIQSCIPIEIQLIQVGPWKYIGWSGEVFVEYALAVKKSCRDTFVISLANGTTQGYIATKEAVEEGGYEANNSLFSWETGNILVSETEKLCK